MRKPIFAQKKILKSTFNNQNLKILDPVRFIPQYGVFFLFFSFSFLFLFDDSFAQAGNEKKIVLFLTLTGQGSEHPNKVKNGFQLALQEMLTKGKVSLAPIDIQGLDDKSLKARFDSARSYPEVISILTTSSPQTKLIVEEPGKRDILVVSATASSSQLLGIENLLLIAPSNFLQAKVIYQLLEKRKINRFAILFADNIYSQDLFSLVHSHAMAGELRRGTTDNMNQPLHFPALAGCFPVYNGHVPHHSLVQLSNIQTLLFLGFPKDFMTSLPLLKGYDYQWFASDALHDGQMLQKANELNGNLTVVTFGILNPEGNDYQNFVVLYKKKYAVEPDVWAALGYDAGIFLKKTILKLESANQEISRSNLLKAGREVTFTGLTGKKGFDLAHKEGVFDSYKAEKGVWKKNEDK